MSGLGFRRQPKGRLHLGQPLLPEQVERPEQFSDRLDLHVRDRLVVVRPGLVQFPDEQNDVVREWLPPRELPTVLGPPCGLPPELVSHVSRGARCSS